MKWAVPLAAIPAVASFIGGQLFGYGAFGINYKPALGAALTNALTQYVVGLVGVWLIALIIDWLAPEFRRDQGQGRGDEGRGLFVHRRLGSGRVDDRAVAGHYRRAARALWFLPPLARAAAW